MSVFNLLCEKPDIHYIKMLYGKIGVTILYNFALRKFDFRGRQSATPNNREWSEKTQERTALKNGGDSLAVSSYLQKSSAPPPRRPEPAMGSVSDGSGGGGGLQNGKIAGLKLFAAPLPSRQGKTLKLPLFKGGKLFALPPFSMVKTFKRMC